MPLLRYKVFNSLLATHGVGSASLTGGAARAPPVARRYWTVSPGVEAGPSHPLGSCVRLSPADLLFWASARTWFLVIGSAPSVQLRSYLMFSCAPLRRDKWGQEGRNREGWFGGWRERETRADRETRETAQGSQDMFN